MLKKVFGEKFEHEIYHDREAAFIAQLINQWYNLTVIVRCYLLLY